MENQEALSAEQSLAPATASSAHTPGPWRLKHSEPKPDYEYPYMILEGGDVGEGGFHLTGIVRRADANLLRAAPDMLTALRDLRDDIAKLKWGQSYSGRNHALMDRVEAVLAEATGAA